MLKIIFILLFSISLYALHYPKPFNKLATPLFQARIQFDSLVYQSIFRQQILIYQAESDRVLGRYRLIKVSDNFETLQRYYTDLKKLENSYHALVKHIFRHLPLIIDTNQYDIFLEIFNRKYTIDISNPYLREKVYTYYHAHRQEGISRYLDKAIAQDWEGTAHYYTKKHVNYANVGSAYHREVTLLTSKYSPYGHKVEGFFKKHHVKFVRYDIDESEKGKALFKQYKGKRIPLVIINNDVVEGYNEVKMDKYLRH